MLINKWLVIDSILKSAGADAGAGLCLYLKNEPPEIAGLLEFIQKALIGSRLCILLDGVDFDSTKDYDEYIEKILTIFFQPCYYHHEYHPVLFIKNNSDALRHFLHQLHERAIRQGVRDIVVLESVNENDSLEVARHFSYRISRSKVDLAKVVRHWLNNAMNGANVYEINLLIERNPHQANLIIKEIDEAIVATHETTDYRMAALLYQKQREIEEFRHQLLLKNASEKYYQLYLGMQKEERANGLKWYHHEYEVLPTWFKRFGHVIKVIMGKRSFKSLFNDNVKKYKD